MGAGLVGDQVQSGAGIGNPQEGHEIDLAPPGILARRLPDDGGLALDIQQVVDNLVGQSQVVGEGQKGVPLRLTRVRQDQGQFEGGGDQRPRLEPLHPGHGPQVVAVPGQVDHLAAAHAARA